MTQRGYITSHGLRLYYEIEGTGQPLILLNGGPGFSHEYFEPLRALATDAQLVFFDQRGTGRSDKALPSQYTIEAHVDDVEQLRQELCLDTCIIFGHSWGGMLAQAYVVAYPTHVAKLILADTFSTIEDVNLAVQRMRDAVPPETQAIYERYERAGLYKNHDRYPDEYQKALEVAYEPVSLSVPPPPYLQDMFSKVAYDVYRAMWGEESEFKVTGTLSAFNVVDRLSEIQVPTLVIVGVQDMPSIDMARRTADRIPHARLEVFEHSRHFPFIEEPEKFYQLVRQFIRTPA
jgi:proline-specific peptidase